MMKQREALRGLSPEDESLLHMVLLMAEDDEGGAPVLVGREWRWPGASGHAPIPTDRMVRLVESGWLAVQPVSREGGPRALATIPLEALNALINLRPAWRL